MKKLTLFSVAVLTLALASPTQAQTTPPTSAPAGAPMQQAGGGRREHHPEIHHAIHALEHAKEMLEKAAHDYGGHRQAAIEHIDMALKELHEALEFDKH
jgi:Spy/CpxP family protein refolding chaperone